MKQSLIFILIIFVLADCSNQETGRTIMDFNSGWKFFRGNDSLAFQPGFDDSGWQKLNLPHDWSIEGTFIREHPAGVAGGALPGGIGWYRKSFQLPQADSNQQLSIEFDGVYQNSEVWINGNYLGKRPYGYSSFRYDITPYLNFGENENIVAVKVDNSLQPNSRWYTGSGIYRNVRLVKTGKVLVDHWGVFVTTPKVTAESASVLVQVKIRNQDTTVRKIQVKTEIIDAGGNRVAMDKKKLGLAERTTVNFEFEIREPVLWSVDNPALYVAKVSVLADGKLTDTYETNFGVRFFEFNAEKGFFLNGKHMKLRGVNHHHDLGALGAAVNTRAIERQLEMYREMGVNAIRTAHNPPAPEFLALCDKMGFLVMDEAFDMWAKKKNKYDYHLYWDEWHRRDLQDMVLRDRNHPSVFMWSIGNEIREQFDSTGITIARELADIVKALDPTRPVTCALTEQAPDKNYIYQSGALDVISFNYKHTEYPGFPKNYPGEKMLASENMSALATRGHYDMPSDSIRVWPPAYNVAFDGNGDFTCSAYDNVHAYWGATHEDTWKVISENDFIAGMFIWSGFDYLGEPVPYEWPARSSYYGVIDLAGFPKDAFYLYKSLWTNEPVLHVFPHWNWEEGREVDVWAYYNQAGEVELFLNGNSLGIRKKEPGKYHVMWRVKFEPGTIRAVSRKNGHVVLEKEIQTAGEAARVELSADRESIDADERNLVFITVKIIDAEGNLVPDADNPVHFDVKGEGTIAGVDNGYQASHEPFKSNRIKAFNGMCLLIVQSTGKTGNIIITASAEGLESKTIELITK